MTLTKTDRERVTPARRALAREATEAPGPQQNPRRRRRQGTQRYARAARSALAVRRRGAIPRVKSTRLSATDISALASMKNVAKCDTWCELQNPVNHRVFERKLRPRPSGRGHACLGVTPKDAPRAPPLSGRARGRGVWPPAPRGAVGRSSGCRRSVPGTAHGGQLTLALGRSAPRRAAGAMAPQDPNAPRANASDRDPRSGGTTR